MGSAKIFKRKNNIIGFSDGAYDEKDYLRDYDKFKKYKKKEKNENNNYGCIGSHWI